MVCPRTAPCVPLVGEEALLSPQVPSSSSLHPASSPLAPVRPQSLSASQRGVASAHRWSVKKGSRKAGNR